MLGSEQWPEKTSEKNSKSSLKKHFKYFNQSTMQEKKKEEKEEVEKEINFMDLMVQCERENEGVTIYKSATFVFIKGFLLGLLLRGTSSFFLFFLTRENERKNGRLYSFLSLLRFCLFFSSSSSLLHLLFRYNIR